MRTMENTTTIFHDLKEPMVGRTMEGFGVTVDQNTVRTVGFLLLEAAKETIKCEFGERAVCFNLTLGIDITCYAEDAPEE